MSKKIFGKSLFYNIWVADDNPYQIGIFVRSFTRKGRCNSGKHYELTDGKGHFWEIQPKSLIDVTDGVTKETQTLALKMCEASGVWASK